MQKFIYVNDVIEACRLKWWCGHKICHLGSLAPPWALSYKFLTKVAHASNMEADILLALQRLLHIADTQGHIMMIDLIAIQSECHLLLSQTNPNRNCCIEHLRRCSSPRDQSGSVCQKNFMSAEVSGVPEPEDTRQITSEVKQSPFLKVATLAMAILCPYLSWSRLGFCK